MRLSARIESILKFLDEQRIPYTFQGDKMSEVNGFSSLKNYKAGTFTWAKNKNAYVYDFTEKQLVIVQEGLRIDAKNVIISAESRLAFFKLIEWWADSETHKPQNGIGEGTFIGSDVKIGKDVIIGSNCVIEGNIAIGDYTSISHNVTILNNVKIGSHCEIQSGCVIGHDGFAWNENAEHEKDMIRHFGSVEIGDNVYIGPNCVIDRGEIDATTIGDGCKLDAQCFLAHNVSLGKNVMLIAGSKLYGSAELGDNAYVASGIIRNQCKIGENSFVGMGAVVTRDLPAGATIVGVPARIIKRGDN